MQEVKNEKKTIYKIQKGQMAKSQMQNVKNDKSQMAKVKRIGRYPTVII